MTHHQASGQSAIAAWHAATSRNRGSDRARLSFAAFRALVAGRMATPEEVVSVTGIPGQDAAHLARTMAAEGRLVLDDAGRITGAGGLSLTPSNHTLEMLGRRYGAWCALDAVGIPAGLGADARVISSCADTGEVVSVEIITGIPRSVEPEGVTISLVPPVPQALLQDCCSAIRFHADQGTIPAAASPVSVVEAAELGRELWHEGVPL